MEARKYVESVVRHRASGSANEHGYRGDIVGLLESIDTGITAINKRKRAKFGAPEIWEFQIGDYQVCQK